MTNNGHDNPLDSKALRARLSQQHGKQFWRSLEELAGTETFQQFLEDEFPQQARPLRMEVDRRQFLTLMGASLALAGLSGCRFLPQDKIVPYVEKPEDIVPGLPLYFATASTLGGYAFGLVAESHEGRPTKLEGNPQHPASLGAVNIWAQSSILNLYDPDRAVNITSRGDIRTWDGQDSFMAGATAALAKLGGNGAGLRILTETVTSPTLTAAIRRLQAKYPGAQWHQYEPINRDNVHEGARMAFGEALNPVYRFDQADVILSLDSSFLETMPGSVAHARRFADRRRVRAENMAMGNRLYAVESTPTLTGAAADHQLNIKAAEIELYARALAKELGVAVEAGTLPPSIPENWIKAVAADLRRSEGKAVVVVGDQQPPVVHALAHAMNSALGAINTVVTFTAPVESEPGNKTESLRGLVNDMTAGKVQMLFILGGNPAYTAPRDIDFAGALNSRRVPFTAHLSAHNDETGVLCDWHIPESHYLEAWGDARAFDGTVSIVQPLIAPLYDSRSALEVLAALLAEPITGYDLVRNQWRPQSAAAGFDALWEKTLNDGVMAGTALPAKPVTLAPSLNFGPAPAAPSGTEIIFRPDPSLWDGRFANNGWLQELPRPLVRMTWDNAAYMSPSTAVKLGLAPEGNPLAAQEQVVSLEVNGATVEAPVWLWPGHPDDSITVHLGYGRARAGQVGSRVGVNVYPLRTTQTPWFGSGVRVTKAGRAYPMATTQYHHTMEGRDIVRVASIEEFRRKRGDLAPKESHYEPAPGEHEAPGGAEAHAHPERPISLYPDTDHAYDGYAWGMTIDLNTCIGCNACVIACQSENNIPVVGKSQVIRGRAMHWIRIDTYYRGGTANRPADTYFQPVTCMHCEQAPCEPVCPVAATVHSHEGLNQMIYNRCVGTKYCSNNCPYKVRRFNFYKYIAGQPNQEAGPNFDAPSLQLLSNPNVTVRGRGVMEKCTFCVQRINAVRIQSKKENRPIRDGEIVTACQQACPTQTILFGNIADKESRVSKLKEEPHDYKLLDAALNTRPRLSYLAKVENLNKELEPEKAQS